MSVIRHSMDYLLNGMIEGFRRSLETNLFLYPQWMNLPTDVMATVTAGAMMAVICKWLNGDLAYPAEEVAQMVYQLLYHASWA